MGSDVRFIVLENIAVHFNFISSLFRCSSMTVNFRPFFAEDSPSGYWVVGCMTKNSALAWNKRIPGWNGEIKLDGRQHIFTGQFYRWKINKFASKTYVKKLKLI